MSLPSLPVLLVIGVMIIYFIWKAMAPSRRRPHSRKFSIRRHRLKSTLEEEEDEPGSP